MSLSCCLIILNYNGQKHLKDCLPSAVAAARASSFPCSVVVLDNCSTEDDVEYIRLGFPSVEVIISTKNDMLFSLNPAVEQRAEDVVILLNNDIRVDEHFVDPLVRHFEEDPRLFAVMGKAFDWAGERVTTGKRIAWFEHSWLYTRWVYDVSQPCATLYAEGGCSAFRRDRFVALGGFDHMFYPGYCEDMDLSYRAWQRGWTCLFEPSSILYHKIGASMGERFGRSRVTRLIDRNLVLFTIKNCGGTLFLVCFLALLPLRALRSYFAGDRPLTMGILDSLRVLPLALFRRWDARRHVRVSDRQFLAQIRESPAGHGIEP